MNDEIELQLRAALARKEPPPGFAQRTVARATGITVTAPAPRRPARVWVSLALAAMLLIGFSAAGIQRVREQRRADEVKQQLMLALQITSQKLAVVERALDRSTN